MGSNPDDIIHLIEKHMGVSDKTQILDLACGKGPVAIRIAQRLNIHVTGIDLIPEFIDCAKQKANEVCVDSFCHFEIGDINNVVTTKKGYDCVILGSAGNILGTLNETLDKLKLTIKPNGYIMIYDVYLLDAANRENVKYRDNEYLTYEQWLNAFSQSGVIMIEAIPNKKASDNNFNNKAIINRANKLISLYLDKKPIFESFINAQLNGSSDLENTVAGVSWLVQAK